MYSDIVFPDGNEKEFIETAEKLGYGCLVLAYDNASKVPAQLPNSKVKLKTGILALEKEIQKSKQKSDIVLFKASGNDRWVLEKSDADIIFGLEETHKKDFLHHRASGLNQVLCKIAADKEKTIAFQFSAVLCAKGMLRAQIMGKMMQNIRFCRKYKVKTALASFAKSPYQMRAPMDLASFGAVLGMHPDEAKRALSWTK